MSQSGTAVSSVTMPMQCHRLSHVNPRIKVEALAAILLTIVAVSTRCVERLALENAGDDIPKHESPFSQVGVVDTRLGRHAECSDWFSRARTTPAFSVSDSGPSRVRAKSIRRPRLQRVRAAKLSMHSQGLNHLVWRPFKKLIDLKFSEASMTCATVTEVCVRGTPNTSGFCLDRRSVPGWRIHSARTSRPRSEASKTSVPTRELGNERIRIPCWLFVGWQQVSLGQVSMIVRSPGRSHRNRLDNPASAKAFS